MALRSSAWLLAGDAPAPRRASASARALVGVGAWVGVALTGCASPLDNPEDFGVCNSRRVTTLFAERCGTCHGPARAEAGLDLVSARVTTRLVDVLSTNRPCAGLPRIDSQGGSYHLLVDKLRPAPGCGARMPEGGPYLSSDDTDCIGRWVDDLAAGGSP